MDGQTDVDTDNVYVVFCCTVSRTIYFVTVFSVTNMFGDMYCFEAALLCDMYRLTRYRFVTY